LLAERGIHVDTKERVGTGMPKTTNESYFMWVQFAWKGGIRIIIVLKYLREI
jgi:hypothetical protein